MYSSSTPHTPSSPLSWDRSGYKYIKKVESFYFFFTQVSQSIKIDLPPSSLVSYLTYLFLQLFHLTYDFHCLKQTPQRQHGVCFPAEGFLSVSGNFFLTANGKEGATKIKFLGAVIPQRSLAGISLGLLQDTAWVKLLPLYYGAQI